MTTDQRQVPTRGQRHRGLVAAAPGFVALLLLALGCDLKGTCADGSSPPEGSCTCKDNTQLEARDCDACDGSEPQDLGGLSDREVGGSVIAACEREFDFSVGEDSVFQAELSKSSQGLSLTLEAGNGTSLQSVNVGAQSSGTFTANLPPGDYRAVVRSSAAQASPFRLVMHATKYGSAEDPNPGSSQDDPHDFGTLKELETVAGFVASSGQSDYYHFDIAQISTLTYAITDVRGNVHLDIFADAPIVTANAAIGSLDAKTGQEDPTRSLNLPRGSYFARVTAAGSDSLYELRLNAVAYENGEEADPEPSDDWTEASDLGVVGEDPLRRFGYVGGSDTADWYMFQIEDNAKISYALSEVVGHVRATLYTQAPLLDPAVYEDYVDSTGAQATGKKTEEDGTFYVRVTLIDGAPALYTLSLSVGQ